MTSAARRPVRFAAVRGVSFPAAGAYGRIRRWLGQVSCGSTGEGTDVAWIDANIRWIMMVSGALTLTMFYAAIAPEAAFQSTFGESLGVDGGPATTLVVRNWGVLIGLVGASLLLGAFHEASRLLALKLALLSKATFIGLVLAEGGRYLRHQAGVAIAIDAVMVVLFAWYLLAGSLRRR